MGKGKGGLTSKQRAFVEYYLGECYFNGAEAARKAGYAAKSANVQAAQNLASPSIQQAIANRLADMQVSADEVLSRLADQARGTMDDFVTFYDGGRIPAIDFNKARERGKLHLLKKFSITKAGITFELYDAQAALTLIGKHLALFADVSLKGDEVDEWREFARKHDLEEQAVIAEAQRIANSRQLVLDSGGEESSLSE